MKKFIFQSVLLLLVIFFALIFFRGGGNINLPFFPQQSSTAEVTINNAKFKADVADTSEKRKKGLSEKPSLGSDEGMLFIFESVGKYSFWMKGLTYSLDFIWIRDDKVVDISENVAAPLAGQKDESLPIYQSKEDINKMLEVNAGTAQKFSIKAGDSVLIQ